MDIKKPETAMPRREMVKLGYQGTGLFSTQHSMLFRFLNLTWKR